MPVYQPGRPIEEVARELGLPAADIIKLASNENPLGPSPAALAAMETALPQSASLSRTATRSISSRNWREKLGVEPANLILGNGSNEIIEFVGHALMTPGADVVVSQYCFAVYPIVAQLFGANLITVPARDYGHDLPAMLPSHHAADTSRVRRQPEQSHRHARAAPEISCALMHEFPTHVLLVMDEAYIEFLDDPVDLLPLHSHGLKPESASDADVFKNLSAWPDCARLRHWPSGIDRRAGKDPAAIQHQFPRASRRHWPRWTTSSTSHANPRNNLAGTPNSREGFRRLRLEFVPSAANFILVRVGDGQRVFAELQKQGVIMRPMAGYQLPEWIRISVGTPAENARCLEALKRDQDELPGTRMFDGVCL